MQTFRAFGPYKDGTEVRVRRRSWSSRQREAQGPVVGLANCFATRCGRSRIQSKTMQLGLRFATAKLPGLRAGRVVGKHVEPGGGLGAQRSRSWTQGFPLANRQARCTIKKGSAVEP